MQRTAGEWNGNLSLSRLGRVDTSSRRLDDGWQQVTCGVYRPSFLAAATDVLDTGGRSIITALDRVDTRLVTEPEWRTWNEDGRSWFSVDSQERLEQGLQRYE